VVRYYIDIVRIFPDLLTGYDFKGVAAGPLTILPVVVNFEP